MKKTVCMIAIQFLASFGFALVAAWAAVEHFSAFWSFPVFLFATLASVGFFGWGVLLTIALCQLIRERDAKRENATK